MKMIAFTAATLMFIAINADTTLANNMQVLHTVSIEKTDGAAKQVSSVSRMMPLSAVDPSVSLSLPLPSEGGVSEFCKIRESKTEVYRECFRYTATSTAVNKQHVSSSSQMTINSSMSIGNTAKKLSK